MTVSREAHERFWERAAVRFHRATRLSLYRRAEIYARDSVSLETSTLSGWVGVTAAAFTPLVDALAADIMRSDAPACRRHAGTGAGARQWQDKNRAAVGLRD